MENNYTLQKIYHKYQLFPKKQYYSGNSGAIVIQCTSLSLGDLVLKLAINERSTNEIKYNKFGHFNLIKEGLEILLPSIRIYDQIDNQDFILMSYLGESILDQIKNAQYPLKIYQDLCFLLEPIYTKSLKQDNQSATFLCNIKEHLIERYSKNLFPNNLISSNIITKTISFPLEKFTSSYSCFACYDFTPEDIFINNQQLKYPDPRFYIRGNPLIDLACFAGVSAYPYQLPESKKGYNLIKEFAINTVGKLLSIDQESSQRLFYYGQALQLAISAKVRINKNDTLAKELSCMSTIFLEKAIKS